MTQVNSYKDIPSKSSCQLEKINGHDRWEYTSRNRQNRHNVFVHVVKHLI